MNGARTRQAKNIKISAWFPRMGNKSEPLLEPVDSMKQLYQLRRELEILQTTRPTI